MRAMSIALAPEKPRSLTARPHGGPAEPRVGVEIEFYGLSPARAAKVLARDLGGRVEAEDDNAWRVRGGALGDLSVEMDLRHLHPGRHPDVGWRLRPGLQRLVGRMLSPVVPCELVTGPLPRRMLPEVDLAVAALRAAGATGRRSALVQSTGLHFNVDPPSLDAGTLAAYLKAYIRLEDDLAARVARGSPAFRPGLPPPFPAAYRTMVLDPGYWPALEALTDDYLDANPTRRRGLDLLPVLALMAPERVRSRVPHEKIGPRAAFHYRLPQAFVGDPGWSVMREWSEWLRVDRAARALRSEASPGRFAP